jgi:hypothetical protein
MKTLDPDPDRYSAENAGSGSVTNKYGSETLVSGVVVITMEARSIS